MPTTLDPLLFKPRFIDPRIDGVPGLLILMTKKSRLIALVARSRPTYARSPRTNKLVPSNRSLAALLPGKLRMLPVAGVPAGLGIEPGLVTLRTVSSPISLEVAR